MFSTVNNVSLPTYSSNPPQEKRGTKRKAEAALSPVTVTEISDEAPNFLPKPTTVSPLDFQLSNAPRMTPSSRIMQPPHDLDSKSPVLGFRTSVPKETGLARVSSPTTHFSSVATMEEPPQIRKTVSTSELVTSEYDEMELAESITDTGFKQITPSNSAEAMEEPELLDLGFNTTNPTGNTSRNLSQVTPSPSAETMEDPDDYESELIDLSFNTTNPKSFTSRGLSQFPPLPIAETMEEPTQIKRAVSTSALKTSASDELSSILTSQDDSTLFDRPRDGRSCNIEAMFKSLSLSKE